MPLHCRPPRLMMFSLLTLMLSGPYTLAQADDAPKKNDAESQPEQSEQKPDEPQTYAEMRDFLAAHTDVVELSDESGARVVICPQYQGRVMISSCDGPDGQYFGWVNSAFIRQGKTSKQFNNYGGEDRFWLGPEAGQFGLFFEPGAKQQFDNWTTPRALNEGAFRHVPQEQNAFSRLTSDLTLINASKTRFQLRVTRDVRLLRPFHFGDLFGEKALQAFRGGKLKMVAFETRNTITNRGAAMAADSGLLAIWILGMFQPGDETVIMVPYRAGKKDKLGPVVATDYFGELPEERFEVTDEAVLFLGDGRHRSKIGISQRRAVPKAGSIDFTRGVLTLVEFTMPDNPARQRYVNNLWQLPQKEPFVGDVFNSYNDGPTEPGAASLGGFYELETMSPAGELKKDQSLTHHHRTFHIVGPIESLAKVAREALGVDLEAARRFAEAAREARSKETTASR